MVQPTVQQNRKKHKKNISKSLFSKNTVNISYSCTRNIKNILNSHNAKFLFPKKGAEERTCNCLNKDNRPLEQKMSHYIAKVTSSNGKKKKKIILARVKTPLKNDFQITKSNSIYMNIRMKQNYQMKPGG